MLRQIGKHVPDDVAVIGRHDTPWAVQTDPTLTSLSFNPDGLARAIVAGLHEPGLSNSSPFTRLAKVPPQLVVRGSTSAAERNIAQPAPVEKPAKQKPIAEKKGRRL